MTGWTTDPCEETPYIPAGTFEMLTMNGGENWQATGATADAVFSVLTPGNPYWASIVLPPITTLISPPEFNFVYPYPSNSNVVHKRRLRHESNKPSRQQSQPEQQKNYDLWSRRPRN